MQRLAAPLAAETGGGSCIGGRGPTAADRSRAATGEGAERRTAASLLPAEGSEKKRGSARRLRSPGIRSSW